MSVASRGLIALNRPRQNVRSRSRVWRWTPLPGRRADILSSSKHTHMLILQHHEPGEGRELGLELMAGGRCTPTRRVLFAVGHLGVSHLFQWDRRCGGRKALLIFTPALSCSFFSALERIQNRPGLENVLGSTGHLSPSNCFILMLNGTTVSRSCPKYLRLHVGRCVPEDQSPPLPTVLMSLLTLSSTSVGVGPGRAGSNRWSGSCFSFTLNCNKTVC